jgi:hypothetical protein
MQTECLVRASESTRLTVKVRFLQIVQRSVGRLRPPGLESPPSSEPEFDPVDRLEVGGRVYQPWQEAVEREVSVDALNPASLSSMPELHFAFPAAREVEALLGDQGQPAGVIVREWDTVTGSVEFDSKPLREGVIKVTVGVRNLAAVDLSRTESRDGALRYSLVSAHTILGVDEGEFLSLLEPPQGFEDLVEHCKNIGTWPVLAGAETEAVLSSPIILYDHPQIAPESAGNLFDSTEIDEILSLRILTLTDDEKQEMRQSDDRTREILERTERMPDEQFMNLHGVLRGLTQLGKEAR